MRREVTPNVVRHIDTSKNREGMIIYSKLNEANAEEIINDQEKYFERIEQDFEWKVFDHDKPADLKERLKAHGFVIEDAEALMVLNLEEAPEILQQPVLHNVQRIKDPQKIEDILRIEHEVWNEDFSALGDYLHEALLNYPDQMSVYVAYVDELPASTAWAYFPKHSQFASLWGGASLSGFRKQGLYTALLAMRAQEARVRQVRYLTVDASDMSRPILDKFGFNRIAWIYPCKWTRKSQEKSPAA